MDRTALENNLLLFLRAHDEQDWIELATIFRSFSAEDWDQFLAALRAHKLAPLSYRKLQSRAIRPAVPDEIFQKLRGDYLSNLARNTRFYHVLKNVLSAFHKEGISVIILKGVHIASLVYRDIGARTMVDADILVREKDLIKADAVLAKRSFRSWERHHDPTLVGNAFHYVNDKTGLLIEVHCRLFSAFPFSKIDQEVLWSSADDTHLAGSPARVLSTEDLLIHISIHTSIHMFHSGLRDLCDINEIVRFRERAIDWERVHDRARVWKAENPIYLVLLMAVRLLGAGIPEEALYALRQAGFDEAFYGAGRLAVLTNGIMMPRKPVPTLSFVLFIGKRGSGPKLGVLIKRIFPSRETLAAFFGISPRSRRLPYYYFKWIGGLIWRNAPRFSRLLVDRVRGRKSTPVSELAPLMNWLISP